MIRIFPDEQWKEFFVENKTKRHAVSSFGRLVWFTDKIEDGTLIKGGLNYGYKTFTFTIADKKGNRLSRYLYVRRLVAENFLPKTSPDQQYVLLLDHNRGNNFVGNLKWATREEMRAHRTNNPIIIEANKKLGPRKPGSKLTTTEVIRIKKKLMDPNRKTRMKILAKQFGISEMQLYRIKSGENWGDIIVD